MDGMPSSCACGACPVNKVHVRRCMLITYPTPLKSHVGLLTTPACVCMCVCMYVCLWCRCVERRRCGVTASCPLPLRTWMVQSTLMLTTASTHLWDRNSSSLGPGACLCGGQGTGCVWGCGVVFVWGVAVLVCVQSLCVCQVGTVSGWACCSGHPWHTSLLSGLYLELRLLLMLICSFPPFFHPWPNSTGCCRYGSDEMIDR